MDLLAPKPVDISMIKRLDVKLTPIKLDPNDPIFARLLQAKDFIPPKPTPEQIEANKPYAEIIRGGKVVGTVFKGGSCTTSNAIGLRLQSFFAATDDRDARAEAIAKAEGGTIRYVKA